MSTESPPAPAADTEERPPASRPADDLRQQVYNSPKERAIKYALGACALVSVLTTLGIAAVLVLESIPFFQTVALTEFFGDTRWTPQFANKHFGIWALLSGTVLVTVISAVVALPIGLASAIFISEYASEWVRKTLKPGLELLAGVPTVVYGYFALTFVTPLLQAVIPGLGVYNALSAGIVVGIMIIPMVASLSEDALQAVPDSLEEAAYALGATKFETVLRVNVPAAFSGIMASFILGVSRAIGETMIVTLAAGATAKTTLNPLQSIQTMTAFIVQVSKGDTPQGTIVYQSIFAVGLVLFLITLAMNILANRITLRYQEKY
ncbi:MAG: phosphate ABC transporter permease subunit PstC [Salinibacter sp.]